MSSAFEGCSNLTYNASDKPDLSQVTNMAEMFKKATKFNGDIGNWDVSNVKILSRMFSITDSFNQDIGGWDVSNVKYMAGMFNFAIKFNQDLSEWNVSNVKNMEFMFRHANNFNHNISGWDINNITTMKRMLNFSNLSRKNYDNILEGWLKLDSLQSNVDLGAASLTYCLGAKEKDSLKQKFGWTFSGDSKNCEQAVLLSNNVIYTNYNKGDTIGHLLTYPDTANTEFKYSLSSKTEENTSNNFTISGNALKTDQSFNNDSVRFLVKVKSYTENGTILTDSFPIKVKSNQAPTAITLSSQIIKENNEPKKVIGIVSTKDKNNNENHTYSLVNGNKDRDNDKFSIRSDRLIANKPFGYEKKKPIPSVLKHKISQELPSKKPLPLKYLM